MKLSISADKTLTIEASIYTSELLHSGAFRLRANHSVHQNQIWFHYSLEELPQDFVLDSFRLVVRAGGEGVTVSPQWLFQLGR